MARSAQYVRSFPPLALLVVCRHRRTVGIGSVSVLPMISLILTFFRPRTNFRTPNRAKRKAFSARIGTKSGCEVDLWYMAGSFSPTEGHFGLWNTAADFESCILMVLIAFGWTRVVKRVLVWCPSQSHFTKPCILARRRFPPCTIWRTKNGPGFLKFKISGKHR